MSILKNNFSIKNSLNVTRQYIVNRYINGIIINSTPIFIVGCGHSGTSLALAIIGSHSKIYAVPYESKIAYKTNKKKYFRKFNKLAIAAGKTRWIEKTPRQIYILDELFEYCPDCKIILMLRDGRDVCYSFKTRFGDIEPGIEAWINDNKAGEKFWNHPNVYVLRYENIIKDFESTLRKALNFIGEEFESEMKEFYKIPRYYYSDNLNEPSSAYMKNHHQYRNWQINQPLFDGRGKWKALADDEKNIIKTRGNDMLIKYGYVEDDNW